MTDVDLGHKRRCVNCASAFFDLWKNPIVCPKCGSIVESIAAKGSKKSRKKQVEEFNEALFLADELPKDVLVDEDDNFFVTEE